MSCSHEEHPDHPAHVDSASFEAVVLLDADGELQVGAAGAGGRPLAWGWRAALLRRSCRPSSASPLFRSLQVNISSVLMDIDRSHVNIMACVDPLCVVCGSSGEPLPGAPRLPETCLEVRGGQAWRQGGRQQQQAWADCCPGAPRTTTSTPNSHHAHPPSGSA